MFFCSHRCSGANVLLWWYQLPPLMRRSYCSLIIHHYKRAQISPGYLLIRLVFFIYLCLHVATKAVTIAWIKDPILPWSLSNFKLLLNIVLVFFLIHTHFLSVCPDVAWQSGLWVQRVAALPKPGAARSRSVQRSPGASLHLRETDLWQTGSGGDTRWVIVHHFSSHSISQKSVNI